MPYIPPKTLPPGATPNLQPIRNTMSQSSHISAQDTPQPPNGRDNDLEVVSQLASTHLSPAPIDPPPPPASLADASADNVAPVPSRSAGSTTPASISTASQSSSDDGPAVDPSPPLTDSESEDPIVKYRAQLYIYTHNLYLQAKYSKERKEDNARYSQFGQKPSGMERMAARKALARRLNE